MFFPLCSSTLSFSQQSRRERLELPSSLQASGIPAGLSRTPAAPSGVLQEDVAVQGRGTNQEGTGEAAGEGGGCMGVGGVIPGQSGSPGGGMCTQTRRARGPDRLQRAWGRVHVTCWRNGEEGREVLGPSSGGPSGTQKRLTQSSFSYVLMQGER